MRLRREPLRELSAHIAAVGARVAAGLGAMLLGALFYPKPGASLLLVAGLALLAGGMLWTALSPPRLERLVRAERKEYDLTSVLSTVAVGIVFAAVVIGLGTIIRPDLFFSTTLPAGGDMGAHHYIPRELARFLPVRWSGWSDGWYAGFPMLHFYFPLPYAAIVVLEKIVGYAFAFRVVSLAGIAGFPFACYFCLRWMGLPQPVPVFGAAGGFVYVTNETFSILGGNVASTMAGQFPFAISISLSVLLLGLLWRGTRTGRGLVPAALLTGAMVLSHNIPVFMIVPAALLIAVGRWRDFVRRLGFVAVVGAAGALLAAFWLIPSYLRIDYTAHAMWVREWSARYLTGGPICTGGCHQSVLLALFLGAGAVGLGIALDRREWPPFVFALTAGLMAVLAYVFPTSPILNTRFIPMYDAMVVLTGAYGLGMVTRLLVVDLGHAEAVLPAVSVVLAGVVIVGANAEIRFIRGWVQYNYSGYEAKSGYAEYRELMGTLDTLPPGRVLWEYDKDFERFGTTRSLELVPYWTDKPSMEGLLVESSLTAPFHFIMQNEVSHPGTGAVPGLRYPASDMRRGLEHAALFDITYYVGYSEQAKSAAKDAGLTPFTETGQFTVYRLEHKGMVSVPTEEPLVATGRDWYAGGLDWFCFSDLERFVVFPQGGEGPRLASLPHLEPRAPPLTNRNEGVGGKHCGRGDHALNDDIIDAAPGRRLPKGDITVRRSGGGVVEFDTDQVGVPHVVATSWFPTWKADGAEGPYLVSPSLMLVIPTRNHVKLTEGRRGLDWLAHLVSAAGVALLVGIAARQRQRGLLFAPPNFVR